MTADQFILFSTAIIKNNRGEVLLLKRSNKNTHYKNYWQLPEGKIEKGESPECAILRELQEELSFSPIGLKLRWIIPISIKVSGVNLIAIRVVFTTRGISIVKLSRDHSKYKWCIPLGAIKNLKLVPGTKETLRNL